jgi:superfamily II DNA or RNA helicase
MPSSPRLTNFELHRTGIGLVPDEPGERDTALYVLRVPGLSRPLRSCTCAASRRRTCGHLTQLGKGAAEIERLYPAGSWERVFAATPWHGLAAVLFEGEPLPCAEARVAEVERGGRPALRFTAPDGADLALYLDGSPARVRLLERTGKVPKADGFFDRAALLDRLALFQATPEERTLNQRGFRTRRQVWEESFWHRLAYHAVREFGHRAGSFHPAVDQASGRFTLTFRDQDGEPLVELTVPRSRVQAALAILSGLYPDQEDLIIHPVPLRSIFRVRQSTDLDLEVRPAIAALQEAGEERFYEQEDFEKFRYGNLVYVRELGVLAELERESRERRFKAPTRMRLKRSQVPSFLAEYREALSAGALVLDEPLSGLRVFKDYDSVTVSPQALDRSWYWLAVRYGLGNESISLADLLRARREGHPYFETRSGWVDLQAPAFRHLADLAEAALAEEARAEAEGGGEEAEAGRATGEAGGGSKGPVAAKAKGGRSGAAGRSDGSPEAGPADDWVRLSARGLLRLSAALDRPVALTGEEARRSIVERLLAGKPPAPFAVPPGLASPLRPYQVRGAEWLSYLADYGLGGLLCDDMGLGKTHQAMALMLALAAAEGPAARFLVVCPTSVVPHWQAKLADHAPGLAAAVYHGPQRDLRQALREGRLLLTSYGVLRRDVEELARLDLRLAVFDEIQHLKNRDTQAYQAAERLKAAMKLGLTGTPIENAVSDLKALFDLVLPGYLGSDRGFAERFGAAAEPGGAGVERLAELKRLAAPFVLRRLKATVLDELPEKIEDLRTCALSDDQVKLYREVIETRGAALARRIEAAAEPLPYLHVFAVLNLLKQICDHPALALRRLEQAADYASGKWDLFCELLDEALGSGQKVVVFSQYLGMIALMERHLAGLGVGFATLTGSSTDRGTIVDRFNRHPDCRVFLGSLKAGGTGIDLVGGSVVIHYDRWWNAAREDQATDRVHRIGQRRAVQVVKLVSEGTLEEKIGALIDAKRRLADAVVAADDPHLAKLFSREELLALLAPV